MSFDLQPTLRGHLVELHPLRSEHFDALFAVASDPLIWEQHPANDRWRPAVFREFFDEGMASGGAFVVIDARDGRVIGSSRYFGFDADAGEVEIGWSFLARSHWGGRYNGEMKQLMLEHAFRSVRRVIFLVGIHNRRSQVAVEKIGGVRVGERINSAGRESFVYEITAARFDGRVPPYVARLRRLVERNAPRLLAISADASARRPAPGKWSPREIVGHLIDSASHNHQRFVRAQFQHSLVFPGYEQDVWVATQRYRLAPWDELVTLWRTFNLHIARVMGDVPESVRLEPRAEHNLDELAWRPVPADRPATLDFFMDDYVAHLEHHLRQILGDAVDS
jgi:RimJ/RimL family protein N-acetyltransferase